MTNGNEPAFAGSATGEDSGGRFTLASLGLTKREYFAAMALQGLLAVNGLGYNAIDMAEQSVEQADALIAELNRGAV